MNADDKPRCPSCGGLDIRHSLPGGLLDSFMTMFGKTPFRCRRCERRFYRYTGAPPDDLEAAEDTAPVEPAPRLRPRQP